MKWGNEPVNFYWLRLAPLRERVGLIGPSMTGIAEISRVFVPSYGIISEGEFPPVS